MALDKQPFRSYTLEENKVDPLEKGKIFTVRMNPEEYRVLLKDMKDFNIGRESTTLKLLAEIGRNVIHSTFGRSKIKWLMDPSRRKLEE